MRVLIIGGGGLTGRHIVRELVGLGHDVAVFNRGKSSATTAAEVEHLQGDKATLTTHRSAFGRLQPDAVLHMIALTREDAEQFVDTFLGIAPRAIVISSGDVYLAYGRLHGTEPGPAVAYPLTEDSPLRQKLGPEGEQYDKLEVERIATSEASVPCTILRYPAVYGPSDAQRRFYPYVRRVADGRPAILLGKVEADFRFSHVFAADAARASVLCVTNDRAAGRTYNVSEPGTPTHRERIEQLGAALGWHGRVISVPDADVPRDVAQPPSQPDFSHHLEMDSRRIRSELQFSEVVTSEEGYRQTAEWLLANPPSWANAPDYVREDALIAAQ